ncbi:hypothetical protein MC885_015510 [Smutsia gigantea]|nr:hypothetical protein MC885_015510 [Smutsia gigantea]
MTGGHINDPVRALRQEALSRRNKLTREREAKRPESESQSQSRDRSRSLSRRAPPARPSPPAHPALPEPPAQRGHGAQQQGTARGCLEFRSRTGLYSALWVVEVPNGTKRGLGWAEWPWLYP